MTQASSAEWEVALVLPLGAVVNQLRRIEAQLRLLNMKALDLARERDNAALQLQVQSRLEQIGETLGSVAGLVSDIQADISPGYAKVTRLPVDEETASRPLEGSGDDLRPSRETGRSAPAAYKPYPDRDD